MGKTCQAIMAITVLIGSMVTLKWIFDLTGSEWVAGIIGTIMLLAGVRAIEKASA